MSWKGLLEFSRLIPTYSLQLCWLFMHNCKQSRGLGHILWPAGNTTVNTAQEVLDLLYCNFSVLGQGQLVVHQGPPLSSSADLLFSWMTPRVFRCMELSLPRCKTLHFPLLNFMRFLPAHFSSLVRSCPFECPRTSLVCQSLIPTLYCLQSYWVFPLPQHLDH